MDQLKVESAMIKALLARVIKKIIKRKTGCDVAMDFKDFDIVVNDKDAIMHLDLNVKMPKENLVSLVDLAVK